MHVHTACLHPSPFSPGQKLRWPLLRRRGQHGLLPGLGPRLTAVLLGGTWILIALLLLGVLLIAPRAGNLQTDIPAGWAAEHDVQTVSHGSFCTLLKQAAIDGMLAPAFTESQAETMPWGEVHTYEPPDYEALIRYVCECEQQAQHVPALSGKHRRAFVSRAGRELRLDGSVFRFVGFNVPQLLSLAAGQTPEQAAHMAEVLMHSAAGLGLKVARVWAFRDGWDWRPPHYRQQAYAALQLAPGQYNESMFVALDHILAAAARHGVKVTLTLTNWHRDYGGIEAYVKWVKGSSAFGEWTVYDFYTDERIRLLFKAHLAAMVHRHNTVTGVVYRDDPTIFSWDLINEPRCSACPGPSKGDALQIWAAEMSAFMKAIDPNHLVTISSEGYYGESIPGNMLQNPGLWAVCEGVDFERLYSIPTIDYTVAHLYLEMKTWDDTSRQECDVACALFWSKKWITGHVLTSDALLHKPFVLEEFGMPKASGGKDQLFQLVYDRLHANIQAGRTSVAGSNFWAAAVLSEPDWDGYYLYLDSSLPMPTPLGEPLSSVEQAYWDELEVTRQAFRRKPQAEKCYEVVKQQYAHLLDTARMDQRAEYYNATMEIVVQAVGNWQDARRRGTA